MTPEKKKYRCKGCGKRFKSIAGRNAHKEATGHTNRMRHKVTAPANINTLFGFIHGYMGGLDDMPDGAYWHMHEEATQNFNEEFGTDYDWFDVMQDYIEWSNKQ